MRRSTFLFSVASALAAQTSSPTDDELWQHYERWTESLAALPPGQKAFAGARFQQFLIAQGVSKEEAAARYERIEKLRRGSPAREKVYWDAAFKLGGGPDDPLRLLQEAVRKVKPGRALDPAMGRGRNAIWLASQGWDVTGYDISTGAIAQAKAYATEARVAINAVEASHETFDFGANQWDLIVCSYNFMAVRDPKLAVTFHRALKLNGLVVWQSSLEKFTAEEILGNWKQFRLLRFEHLDAGAVDDDWAPSRTFPTFRLVVRKEN